MSITTGTLPGVRIADMPDLGAVTDSSSVVAERAGSGRFNARALRDYTTKGRGYTVEQYGGRADGVTDVGPAVNAIVARLTAEGGGVCLFGTGTYALATPIVINSSNVRLVGMGRGAFHYVAPNWTPGATNIVWTGADGGSMITISPAAGAQQRLVGCEVSGMALISGTYPFSTAAGVGLDIRSLAYSRIDVTTFEFKVAHVRFGVVSGLGAGETANNEANKISIICRALSNAGTVLLLGGTTAVGNTTMNLISYIGGVYYNGTVIDWACCDNNQAELVAIYKAAGGTGTAMIFRGQRTTGGEFARQNKIEWYTEQTSGGTIIVEGTNTSGVVAPSVQNQIVYFDYGDDLPTIIVGTGAAFWYGSNTAPPGKLFENFSYAPSAGVTVDGSRMGDAWGIFTAAGAGTYVINCTVMGNQPLVGVQNIQITPTQAGVTWYVGAATLTGFSLTVNGAGTFFWRVVII